VLTPLLSYQINYFTYREGLSCLDVLRLPTLTSVVASFVFRTPAVSCRMNIDLWPISTALSVSYFTVLRSGEGGESLGSRTRSRIIGVRTTSSFDIIASG
jgi:hypothetical protein